MTIRKQAKQPKPAVSVFVKHGDTCSLAPNCDTLGCASGFASNDWELTAQFVYFQEALDYAVATSARGVRVRVVSRILPNAPYVTDYPKPIAEAA